MNNAANIITRATSFYQDWLPGETYTFNTIVPGILPISYTRVKLEGRNRFNVARQLSPQDLMADWRRIYPSLPAGTPDNPNAVNWLTFESMGGESITLAEEWIDGDTVVVTDFINFNIAVTESSSEQMGRIRDLLSQEGVKFAITLVN